MTVIPAEPTNLTCYQAASFAETYTFTEDDGTTPIDLTGKTALMQVRKSFDDPVVQIELSTENSRITGMGSDGVMNLSISADDTETLMPFGCVWDMLLIDINQEPATRDRIMSGAFVIVAGSTRSSS